MSLPMLASVMGIWAPASSSATSIDGAGRVLPGARFIVVRRAALGLLPSPKATPLAMVIVLALLSSAALLHTHPGDVNAVVAWTSTNVHNLARHPVAAILLSTLVVPGSLFPSLLVLAVALAALERAIGVWRTVTIALSGQVIATLLTEYGADLGARLHLWTESSADRPDVGVSYVMYSVLAAGVLLLPGRVKTLGVIALSTSVLATALTSPDMTSAGHLLSVVVGGATMTLFQRRAGAGVDARRPRWGGSPRWGGGAVQPASELAEAGLSACTGHYGRIASISAATFGEPATSSGSLRRSSASAQARSLGELVPSPGSLSASRHSRADLP